MKVEMEWKINTDDILLTPEQVAERLSVSVDWVRDHSSRKNPRLPVIRLGGGPGRKGLLRYRAREIEEFISELERMSTVGRAYNRNTPPIAAPQRENYGEKVVSEGVGSPQR
jgi:Helix-turn-helix domain